MKLGILGGRLVDGLTLLAALGALILVVGGVVQRTSVDPTREQLAQSIGSSLLGMRPDSFRVVGPGAAVRVVEVGGRGTAVVGVYRKTCPACELNHGQWLELAERLRPVTPLVVISRPGEMDSSFLGQANVEPLAAYEAGEFVAAFPVPAVPATLVIKDGRVRYIRIGLLSRSAIDSVVQVAGNSD